jgi:hypothetical protein
MSFAKMPKTNSLSEDSTTHTKLCAKPGCPNEGLYPAPRNRQHLRDYLWLCLDHVRDYNRAWNYFDGLNGPALEAEIRKATTWERPSWKFGTSSSGKTGWQGAAPEFEDDFGFFEEGPARETAFAGMDAEEKEAWRIFDMAPVSDPVLLKQRYNELAKRYHPDHNGGDAGAEEKLKKINLAYSVLRKKRLNPQANTQ